jgi:hypothetical protein
MENTSIPTIYEHPKFTAWGRGIAFAEHLDRRDFIFENAGVRVFKNDGCPLVPVSLPTAEAAALGRTLRGRRPPVAAAKKPGVRKPAPKRTIVETQTFAGQLELFLAAFPQGFADPKFVAEERGDGTSAGKDAAIALAREVLGRTHLEAQVAAGAFTAVFEAAMRLVDLFEALDFKKAPATTHEAFARALVVLLHGEGPYGPRFEAFAAALPTKRPYWTAATIFPALSRPDEHFFAKPKYEQQEARILRLAEPPSGEPTHAGYVLYAAVGEKVRAELTLAGQKPRDLLDVYSARARRSLREATGGRVGRGTLSVREAGRRLPGCDDRGRTVRTEPGGSRPPVDPPARGEPDR